MTRPFSPEERQVIKRAQKDLLFFLEQVFSRSFDGETFRMADGKKHPFALGQLHRNWARLVQKHNRLCVMAPRMHLKSTILNHAFAFWQLFKADGNVDGIIFSFTDQLAREHVALLKRLIVANPFCRAWVDRKPRSEGMISFVVDFGQGRTWLGEVRGSGIMSASRGRHPKFVICDDVLSDFANPLDPTQLIKIDNLFRQVVMSMPEPNDPLIVVGTPQSYEDTLYGLRDDPTFYWARYPAIIDEESQLTIWPEKFDFRRLERQRKAIKDRAFRVEYLLTPVAAAAAFLSREDVERCADPDLKRWSLQEPFANPARYPVYAGMDVGKSLHPSHIAVFVQMPDGTLMQVFEAFLDDLDYRRQVNFVNRVIAHFDVHRLYYDSTRAELDDRGLSARAHGFKFTKSKKVDLALHLERRIFAEADEPTIILLKHDRMIGQLCAVRKDLSSPESRDGHGDSFWSIALAVHAAEEGPSFVDLGNVNDLFSRRPRQWSPFLRE